MPVLGLDADILLIHPDVCGGQPCGFILTPDPVHGKSAVSIQREVDARSGEVKVYIFFTVLLADDLLNPDGSSHAHGRQTMYRTLLELLGQPSQICVSTVLGTYLGIGPLGHAATESHLIHGSMVSIKLANVTRYRPPVDLSIVVASRWQDNPPAEGALAWEASIWR